MKRMHLRVHYPDKVSRLRSDFNARCKRSHRNETHVVTWDQAVVNHLEHGLWKQGELISGLFVWSQLLSGNSLNTPPSRPAHTTWRCLTPRPHVALHWHTHTNTTKQRTDFSWFWVNSTCTDLVFIVGLPVATPVPPSGEGSLCHHKDRWPEDAVIGRTAPLTSLSHLLIGTWLHAPSFRHRTHLSTETRTHTLTIKCLHIACSESTFNFFLM